MIFYCNVSAIVSGDHYRSSVAARLTPAAATMHMIYSCFGLTCIVVCVTSLLITGKPTFLVSKTTVLITAIDCIGPQWVNELSAGDSTSA